MAELVWINGALVPAAEATVSVFDHGLTVGDGVFETLKVADTMASRRVVDARNLLDRSAFARRGFEYRGIGRS